LEIKEIGKDDFELIKNQGAACDAKSFEKTAFRGLFVSSDRVHSDYLKGKLRIPGIGKSVSQQQLSKRRRKNFLNPYPTKSMDNRSDQHRDICRHNGCVSV
jgi:hypothetical protein